MQKIKNKNKKHSKYGISFTVGWTTNNISEDRKFSLVYLGLYIVLAEVLKVRLEITHSFMTCLHFCVLNKVIYHL